VVDLGLSPLCESFVAPDDADDAETFFPLHARVCDGCFLVQLGEYVAPDEIFREYAYFSSYSDTWLAHASSYVDEVTERFGLDARSFVVELASNDGYLLRNFVARRIPAVGIEPARNVAEAARAHGVETLTEFFGTTFAEDIVADRGPADLVIANNVLAQVPDLNDFVQGISILLAPTGVVTVEFPHLGRLLEDVQYDTIYHEHFSYFSFLTARRVCAQHGIEVFDVEELATHGGSLRLFGQHVGGPHTVSGNVAALVDRETLAGLDTLAPYAEFRERVEESKWSLVETLVAARRAGKHVAGYGAPGKGNTLLNYCGIRTDLLEYTVDRNPYKHGRLTPGTRIPIFPPERIAETRPDLILILPWNLEQEIADSLAYTAAWGASLVAPIPEVHSVR
jgi:hypothetical protein